MPAAMPAPGQPGNPLTPLRQGVVQSLILPDQLKTALVTLIDAAGNDVAKARENIEKWVNRGMESVSGWYKRRNQVIILLLGFGISAVFNIDTITVAQRLSTDKSLRESLVAAAEQYAKAGAESEVQTPAAKPSPSAGAIAAPSPAASPASSPAAANPTASPGASPAPTASSSPGGAAGSATASQSAAQAANPARAEEAFSEAYNKLEQLGLPIGWDTDEAKTLVAHGVLMNKKAWVRKLLGLLITALAVSL